MPGIHVLFAFPAFMQKGFDLKQETLSEKIKLPENLNHALVTCEMRLHGESYPSILKQIAGSSNAICNLCCQEISFET